MAEKRRPGSSRGWCCSPAKFSRMSLRSTVRERCFAGWIRSGFKRLAACWVQLTLERRDHDVCGAVKESLGERRSSGASLQPRQGCRVALGEEHELCQRAAPLIAMSPGCGQPRTLDNGGRTRSVASRANHTCQKASSRGGHRGPDDLSRVISRRTCTCFLPIDRDHKFVNSRDLYMPC